MKVKTGGKCPLPLPAALDVLRKRAELEMGQLTPWEKVAAETLHSKLTVLKVWTWFKSLQWEAAKSLAGDSEQILQLRPDYLDQKQLEKGQPQASLHIKHPSVELFYDATYSQLGTPRWRSLQARGRPRAAGDGWMSRSPAIPFPCTGQAPPSHRRRPALPG